MNISLPDVLYFMVVSQGCQQLQTRWLYIGRAGPPRLLESVWCPCGTREESVSVVPKNYLTGVARERPDFSRQLSEHILDLIESKGLKQGERLPSMKELASLFSVATPTIREALRQLQAIGVVDIRHGSGVYVKNVTRGIMIANPHFGELDSTIVLQLLEARTVIEPDLAAMAAQRADDEDIQRLEVILREAEHLLKGHDDELHTVNMGFHLEIARISGNRVLSQMFESLIELYSHEQLGILALFNARVQDYEDHLQVFDAIRNHDAAVARERMSNHLRGVMSVVEDRFRTE